MATKLDEATIAVIWKALRLDDLVCEIARERGFELRSIVVTYGRHEPDFWSVNGGEWIDANAPPVLVVKSPNIPK